MTATRHPRPTLTCATARLALGRTLGTPGTSNCIVSRAIFQRKDDGTFTCHAFANGELFHHETRTLPGAIETLGALIVLGYAEVL